MKDNEALTSGRFDINISGANVRFQLSLYVLLKKKKKESCRMVCINKFSRIYHFYVQIFDEDTFFGIRE